MTIGAEVDAEVDLGPLVLESIVGLRASFDSLAKHLRDIAKIEEAYQFGSVEVALRGAASSDANGDPVIIDLGGPAYGRLWQLRRLVVGGALYSSTLAGSALVVSSANFPSKTPPLTDIVDEAATLPLPATYSTGQVVVRHPNRLFIIFTAPTASSVCAVGGAVTDMPDKRERIDVER